MLNRFYFGVTLALCASAGCNSPGPTAPQASSSHPRETWEVYYIQGQRVGYAHQTERDRNVGSQAVVEVVMESSLLVGRFGESSQASTILNAVETTQGRLVSFDSQMMLGSNPIEASGRVESGKLILTAAGDKSPTRSIDWPDDAGGFFAAELDLRRHPMQPGERRTLRYLQPMVNRLGEERLTARDYEPTELLSGTQELLRIESVLLIEGQSPLEGVRWTDRAGETLKTELAALQQVAYRATKEQAMEGDATEVFDLGRASLVKLSKPLENARSTRLVRYAVELSKGDPTKTFAVGPTQQVKSTGSNTAEVTVLSIDPREPSCEGSLGTASDDVSGPNSLIQSDDPRIVAMAREAAGDRSTPAEVALALEEWVFRKMRTNSNYKTAFATAAEVAQSLEGDCTEHSVLLAALARASGIPARVAMGLVYSPSDQAFAYHMWTEVLLDRCWVPLDATLGEGRVSADHLKLADSALADDTGLTSFYSVAEVLLQLKIEVLEAK
jgi:hypothetical protein